MDADAGAVSTVLLYAGLLVFGMASMASVAGYEYGRVNQLNLVAANLLLMANYLKP